MHDYQLALQERSGLEIGGPSSIFGDNGILPIYRILGALDDCIFGANTIWYRAGSEYSFHPDKSPGRTIISEASELIAVNDASYDFVLASHVLGHLANPVKALREWHRILKPEGTLILVLPNGATTFDHRRPATSIAHMLEDFQNNVGEDDLTHLPEIFALHDLGMDPEAGDRQAFAERSEKNFQNRCLHHHVFDARNSYELVAKCGFQARRSDLARPVHIFLLATRQ